MAYIERSTNDRVQITSATVSLANKSLWIDCERHILNAGTLLVKKQFAVSTTAEEFPNLSAADRKVISDFIDFLYRVVKTKELDNPATGGTDVIGGTIK